MLVLGAVHMCVAQLTTGCCAQASQGDGDAASSKLKPATHVKCRHILAEKQSKVRAGLSARACAAATQLALARRSWRHWHASRPGSALTRRVRGCHASTPGRLLCHANQLALSPGRSPDERGQGKAGWGPGLEDPPGSCGCLCRGRVQAPGALQACMGVVSGGQAARLSLIGPAGGRVDQGARQDAVWVPPDPGGGPQVSAGRPGCPPADSKWQRQRAARVPPLSNRAAQSLSLWTAARFRSLASAESQHSRLAPPHAWPCTPHRCPCRSASWASTAQTWACCRHLRRHPGQPSAQRQAAAWGSLPRASISSAKAGTAWLRTGICQA